MKRIMNVVLSMALVGSAIAAQAQSTGTATAKTTHKKMAAKKAAGPTISEQLSEMKQAIDAQQQQIKQLSDVVQTRDQKIQQLEQRLDQSQAAATQAQTKADTAVAQSAEEQQTVMALKSDVTDLKTERHELRAEPAGNAEEVLANWKARWPSTSRESRSLRADSWRRNRCTAIARWERTSILRLTA